MSAAPETASGTPRYRFVVRSAEEAVTVIREKLGETARVVSVRQVEGEGLAKFLRSPKLEVMAEVPEQPRPVFPDGAKPRSDSESELRELAVQPRAIARYSPAVAQSSPAPVVPRAAFVGRAAVPPEVPEAATLIAVRTDEKPVRRVLEDPDRLWNVLDRTGLGWKFVAQAKEQSAWQELSSLPLSVALPRAGLLLRDTLAKTPVRPLTARIGFFGTAGSGATTALCKQLVREVFFRQKPVCVMKLEGMRSNPGEGLSAFCEALSVPMLRTPDELAEVKPGTKVYFDLPSLIVGNEENTELKRLFEEFEIGSRVLVVNAAYESELLKMILHRADALKSRHIVYSHLDELTRWGKLWEFVADPRRTTLFASTGQNLAGDCVRDVVELLTQKTLQGLGA